MAGRNVPPIGVAGNAWNAAATGAGGVSPSLNTYNSAFVSAFGHVSATSTLTVQYSGDDTNFYDASAVTTSGAADFKIDCICGAQFVRLKSSAAVTATATIQAKGGG